MGKNPQIHWHEGLFLQPHHLQYMQHNFLERTNASRQLAMSYPLGVIDSKLSYDALENMLIQFDELHVIMPSGLEIHVPTTTDLPSLDIKKVFKSSSDAFVVYLGIPLWYEKRANSIETYDKENDWRVKRLYRVNEIERCDENSGKNPQPIMVRKINARLLLEDDDRSDLDVLPLLKVCHAAGEKIGKPRLDPNFVPPTLLLSGSSILIELVRDLLNQLDASRKVLIGQMSHEEFSMDSIQGIQVEQILRLKTLNRFSARLGQLLNSSGITPFIIFMELKDLLAELCTLSSDPSQFEAASYNHDIPLPAFKELSAKIRTLLSGVVISNFEKKVFEFKDNLYKLELSDDLFTKPNQYYLGIKSNEEPAKLANLVEDSDQFKFMPESMASKAVRGVRLTEERNPPGGLPRQIDLCYFRLDVNGKMWAEVKKEKVMTIRWPGLGTTEFEFTLYMTIPRGREAINS